MYITGGATSFYGVNQANPFGTSATNTGSGVSASVAIPTSAGQMVVDGLSTANPHAYTTTGAGQIEDWETSDSYVGSSHMLSAGSSTTPSWSFGSSDTWEQIAVPINSSSISESR